ncbi:MAG: alpha/beta hydrolase [Bradymonadaceae bacterium]|nr:alpha/beta hydrolase [Lujinxingiaceae bacterium]
MKPAEANSLIGRTMRQSMRRAVRMPAALARGLFGAPVRNDRGAPLDLQTHIMLKIIEAGGTPRLEELGAEQARTIFRRTNQGFDITSRPMHAVDERSCPGPDCALPVRIYRPHPTSARRPAACVFYHGGGFVIGCLDSYDGFCRALAERAGCVVISVDYRLAPEHVFPAAVHDCVAAFRWVREHADALDIDPERIAVAGDSAGANLAAVVCQQQFIDQQTAPFYQLLIYPKVDSSAAYLSHELFGEGFFLTRALITWFSSTYMADADAFDPRLSPLLFKELHALPPAMIITAGFDPLRDEGEAYAKRLTSAGVAVSHRSFDELIHGFISLGGVIDAAQRAVDDIAVEFGRALGA